MSNTHDPDQDGFEDLYCRDFIHTISRVARRKLSHHHLDPYQRAAFRCGIIRYNIGEEEANPTLELAMEYAGALGTIVFDELCRLRDDPLATPATIQSWPRQQADRQHLTSTARSLYPITIDRDRRTPLAHSSPSTPSSSLSLSVCVL